MAGVGRSVYLVLVPHLSALEFKEVFRVTKVTEATPIITLARAECAKLAPSVGLRLSEKPGK